MKDWSRTTYDGLRPNNLVFSLLWVGAGIFCVVYPFKLDRPMGMTGPLWAVFLLLIPIGCFLLALTAFLLSERRCAELKNGILSARQHGNRLAPQCGHYEVQPTDQVRLQKDETAPVYLPGPQYWVMLGEAPVLKFRKKADAQAVGKQLAEAAGLPFQD